MASPLAYRLRVLPDSGASAGNKPLDYADQAAAVADGATVTNTTSGGSFVFNSGRALGGYATSIKFAAGGGGSGHLRITYTFATVVGQTYTVRVWVGTESWVAWWNPATLDVTSGANTAHDDINGGEPDQQLTGTVVAAATTMTVQLNVNESGYGSSPATFYFAGLTIDGLDTEADALLAVTSLRVDTYPYIKAPPVIDAQSVDPVTGRVTIGQATIQVIDADPGSGNRIITSNLTDADGARNLVEKKAILEESLDNGTTWSNLTTGYVTGLRLVDAITFEFTISDTPLDRAKQKVFQYAESGDGYDFSRVSCIIGGPVIGDFGLLRDLGRPKFKVVQVGVSGFADVVALKWIDGGGPLYETLKEYHPGLTTENRDFLNSLADPYKARDGDYVTFPDLVCRLFGEDAAPDTTVGLSGYDFTPLAHYKFSGVGGIGAFLPSSSGDLGGFGLIDYADTITVKWPATGSPAQPSVGAIYRMAVFPQTVSPQNPLHVKAHPVAMAGMIAKARGIAFTGASATDVTNAIGPDLLCYYRITGAMTTREALEKLCFGPFGFAWRQTETGEYEFLRVRARTSAGPVDTIALNDLADAKAVVWEDAEPTKVDSVIYTVEGYSLPTKDNRTGGAIDYLSAAKQPFQNIPADLTNLGNYVQQFDIPAELRSAGGDLNLVNFFAALSQEMFAVYRHGAPTGTIRVLRDATTALLGDEITLNLPHRPATSLAQSPTTQRGSPATVVQILQRQPLPTGFVLTVQNRGIATATTTDPTFTLAASSASPKKVVTVTITNEAALVAAGITNVRVEMALGGSAGYVFVRNWIPGTDPTVFDLPAVDAGSVVTVRMRSEITGQLPGAYTAGSSVDLADLTAPSGFSTSVSGTDVTMGWTVGETDQPVEVLYKRAGDTNYTTAIILAAGSTAYVLTLPDASQGYTVGVRHHEAPPFNGVSAMVTASITTGAAPTLSAPINPAVFSDGAGTYGLEVTATEFPSDTVFAEAVETAVGSGTPGPYSDIGRVTSVQGGRTKITLGPVANDGKLRYLKARAVRNGATDSSATTALSVDPWAVTTPINPPQLYASFDASGDLTVTWVGDAATASIKIAASTSSLPSDATVRAATAQAGRMGTTGTLLTASIGQVAYVKAFAYTGASGAGTESVAATLTLIRYSGALTLDDLGDVSISSPSAGHYLRYNGTAFVNATIQDGDLPSTLSANARLAVRKNSGSTVGTRRRLNLIEGSGVTLTVTDDSTDEEVDVTIAASGGGGGGGSVPTWISQHPDTPPGSANAADDEFDDTTGMSGPVNGLNARWSWNNQGTSSVGYGNGCLLVTAQQTAGTSLRCLEQTISGNGEWTAKLTTPLVHQTLAIGFLGFRISSSGKIVIVEVYDDSIGGSPTYGTHVVQKYTNTTTFSSSPYVGAKSATSFPDFDRGRWRYMQVKYDGTNIYFKVSGSGVAGTFVTLFSEAAATFLGGAPDRVLIGAMAQTTDATIAYQWFRKTA